MRRTALLNALGLIALALVSVVSATPAGAAPPETTGTCSVSGAVVVTVTCTPGSGTWTPPAGLTTADVDVEGGQGGGAYIGSTLQAIGGAGGVVFGILHVTPGSTYTISVGSSGGIGGYDFISNTGFAGAGGVSGGGPAVDGGAGAVRTSPTTSFGSGGGGAGSEIDLGATRLVVAGGGGGGGAPSGNGIANGSGGSAESPAVAGSDGGGVCGGGGGQPGAAAPGVGGTPSPSCTGAAAGSAGGNAAAGVGGGGGLGSFTAGVPSNVVGGAGGGGGGGFFGGGGGAGGGDSGINPDPGGGGGGGGAGASHVDASVSSVSYGSNTNNCTVGGPCIIAGFEHNGVVMIQYSLEAVLSVTKTAPSAAPPDSDITYGLTVTNTSSVVAGEIGVFDRPPAGIAFVSVSTTTAGWNCFLDLNGAVNCASFNRLLVDHPIAPNDSVQFSVVAHVAVNPPSSITNTAIVSAGNAAAVHSNAATTLVPTQLSVSMSGPPAAAPGSDVPYGITVTDTGAFHAINAVVTDTLPSGTTFVPSTEPAGWTCGAAGQLVTCTNTDFAGAAVLSIVAHVASTRTGSLANTASAAADNAPSVGSNTVTTSLDSTLTVSKTGPPSALTGSTITYAVAVTNTGSVGTVNTTVTDTLPRGTTFVPSSEPAGWTCGASGQVVTCTNPAFTGTANLSISVAIDALLKGTLSNTASASASNAPAVTSNAVQTALACGRITGCDAGYWLLGGDGGVFAFNAPFAGSAAGDPMACPPNTSDRSQPDGTCWSMAATPSGNGYWILNGDTGVVQPYGDAQFFGDPAHAAFPNTPREFVPNGKAIVTEPNGKGYWVLDVGLSGLGSVVPLGTSGYYGDELKAGVPHNGTPVGMAATPDGGGYWIVDSDGGVFAYGNAGFFGSLGGHRLNQPIIGIARTPSGRGYYLIAADGGVFAFGDAVFAGSIIGRALPAAVVGIAATSPGAGYWIALADGTVFNFGDAAFDGSMAGHRLNRPIFAITAHPGV